MLGFLCTVAPVSLSLFPFFGYLMNKRTPKWKTRKNEINLFQSICQSTCFAFPFIFFAINVVPFSHYNALDTFHIYIHPHSLYFYNQFSSREFVRAQKLKLLFSFHFDKRICFTSILIELLGEKRKALGSCFVCFFSSLISCSQC